MLGEGQKLFGSDIEEALRAILNSSAQSKGFRLYPGVVEDNNDPDKLGRCRIRVPSYFGTEIPTKDLPWAEPDQTFIGSLAGSFVVPPVGALVNVYFKDDVIYAPHYTTKVLHRKNLPDSRLEDYPDTIVFWESDNGGYLAYNRKKARMEFRHDSGSFVAFDKDGNISVDNSQTKKDIRLVCAGVVSVEAATLKVVNDTGAKVTPNPVLGGPFCALPSCLYTGAPHQGKQVDNCFVKSPDI
jgi:hypothetical protein